MDNDISNILQMILHKTTVLQSFYFILFPGVLVNVVKQYRKPLQIPEIYLKLV
jgi:hypothetical protein